MEWALQVFNLTRSYLSTPSTSEPWLDEVCLKFAPVTAAGGSVTRTRALVLQYCAGASLEIYTESLPAFMDGEALAAAPSGCHPRVNSFFVASLRLMGAVAYLCSHHVQKCRQVGPLNLWPWCCTRRFTGG